MSAPVPVSNAIYPYENATAYIKSIAEAIQLPLVVVWFSVVGFEVLLLEMLVINVAAINTIIPDRSRMIVKLAASIVFSPIAKRQSTEFPANAKRAKDVYKMVFIV